MRYLKSDDGYLSLSGEEQPVHTMIRKWFLLQVIGTHPEIHWNTDAKKPAMEVIAKEPCWASPIKDSTFLSW